jgi:CDP-6-deoxy-D-xylo-4-hexulose-3-dehydrase
MKYPLACDTWDDREIEAIQSVIRSGRYTMGPKVAQFEKEFAQKFGSKHAVMVNSGSTANLLMIGSMVLNPRYRLSPGDEVIVPAVSWSTTYFPVTQYGLKLVFVDIDRATLNIDPNRVKAAVTPKTRAILAVNLLGNSCDWHSLKKIASEHDLLLLEDNCESLGATYDGRALGTMGSVGTFSFFFSHHMQTMEGGMILTDDEDLSQYMRSMRAHGWIRDLPHANSIHVKSGDPFEDSFKFVLPGYSVRPLEMSGAIGSVQLEKLPGMIEARRNNAAFLRHAFKDIQDVQLQSEVGNSSWFGFSIVLQGRLEGRRAEVIKVLSSNGVETRPIVAGNFTKNPVISHCPHWVSGPIDSAEYIDANGFFIGNDSRDLSSEISEVARILAGLARHDYKV